LEIIFHSSEKKSKELYENYSIKKLPGEERIMTRKAQYHFGWDFAPRFITCGIWKDVELIAWDNFKISTISFQTDSLKNDVAYMTARIEAESTEHSLFHISVSDNALGNTIVNAQTEIDEGENDLQFQFTINNPKLWWCNGEGEPYLYNLLVEATDSSGQKNSVEIKTGVRTIEVFQVPDSVGKSFYFKLNGKPVFMRGANYIPQDVFLNRVTNEKYISLLSDVKNANMNMLRVWGGGIYEKEKFYSLCDEKGILVWQDFMFACGMYPFDKSFLENVKEEAEQNVNRLSCHPCIALWCGNNESNEGWHRWGWHNDYDSLQRIEIWNGYQKLFNEILPAAVKKYSNTFYWESSPEFGRGDVRHTKEGDAHNWFVWHDCEPFENYEKKVPRFMTEFGFQSLPDMQTLKSFCPDSELTISSATMKVHQKHLRGFAIINAYMQKKYGSIPKSFSDYVVQSQQLQSDGICLGIKAHLNAKPYCMGSLFWQLNDCWPSVSWSAIDCYGRKKKLYYDAAKLFLEK
jgi:beta-mannosidase